MECAALSFPFGKDVRICRLLVLNATSIFELSELSCSLFKHFVLNNTSLLTVTFVDLLKNISLIVLFSDGIAHSLLLLSSKISLHFIVYNLFFISKAPLLLSFHHFLGTNSLCSVFINLLHKIDAGLVFLLPFIFLKFPLLLALEPSQILNQLLFSLLVLGFLKVEFL